METAFPIRNELLGLIRLAREGPLGSGRTRGSCARVTVRQRVARRLDIPLFFAYSETAANSRKCRVVFTDSEDVSHSVEVVASSLYEAAALAVTEFRRCGFTEAAPGSAARLTISVEAPSTTHELSVRKLSVWLEGAGKSPGEQALKVRLRHLLGRS